ncbi:hypothetical protein D5086_017609 [Populus alba]|uniref:Uncharacterized protein n=1 Tax=Populus alba TaxID=43335 RepID=A0ACC4BNU7_POPAL
MAIIYAVVARGTVVLSEFSAVTGNTGAVARRILEKLPSEADSRLCFSQDRYIFHILRSDGLTFLCMANDTFGRRIPFSYLEDIQMRFMKNYGRVAHYAPAYAVNDEFSRVLHQQMEFFSSNPSADTLSRCIEAFAVHLPFHLNAAQSYGPTSKSCKINVPVVPLSSASARWENVKSSIKLGLRMCFFCLNRRGYGAVQVKENQNLFSFCCRTYPIGQVERSRSSSGTGNSYSVGSPIARVLLHCAPPERGVAVMSRHRQGTPMMPSSIDR